MLFALTIITLIINLVALSAILYRLGEYGFTPNRTAVLGSNILIFGNLVLIMVDLYKTNFMGHAIKMLEITIAKYLPVYAVWTAFVVFVIPLIFGFK
jgi:NADH:ubiquinone oxidoreductase subunit K